MHALVIELAAQCHFRFWQRLLADHVERATRIATAIQAGGRTTQHFQALDGVGVRGIRVATVNRETVAVELTGGEAAHRERGQTLATEVIGASHATGVIERILQARGAGVLDHIARHHADRLWRFMQGGIGAGGAGRTSGLVTFDRAVGTFDIQRIGVDAQGFEFNTGGFLSGLLSPGQRRDSLKQTQGNKGAAHW
ncbi:hypothetical protein D3C73_587320 [compost metagenome]